MSSPGQRLSAVRRVLAGEKRADLAAELGIPISTLHTWVRRHRDDVEAHAHLEVVQLHEVDATETHPGDLSEEDSLRVEIVAVDEDITRARGAESFVALSTLRKFRRVLLLELRKLKQEEEERFDVSPQSLADEVLEILTHPEEGAVLELVLDGLETRGLL